MAFNGASVYNTGDFITPLGKMRVNLEIADKLKTGNKVFNFPVTAHLQEHSIEVQIPFIQYYFKNDMPIVPIIIGTDNKYTVKEIATALKPYFTAENLFTWTNYTGQDPEVSLRGADPFRVAVDYSFTPPTKTYTIGITASF